MQDYYSLTNFLTNFGKNRKGFFTVFFLAVAKASASARMVIAFL